MTDLIITHVSAVDVSKPSHGISTGIGFLDHMIDQFNSHAQIGVSVQVASTTTTSNTNDNEPSHSIEYCNRFANPHDNQEIIMSLVGSALGKEVYKILQQTFASRTCTSADTKDGSTSTSTFSCPLDEALVECKLSYHHSSNSSDNNYNGSLEAYTLSPYGIYPPKTGRTKIGSMLTHPLNTFFSNFAKASKLHIHLLKIRGVNGHHVVESAFKALSRALRNLLDGTDTTIITSSRMNECPIWGISSQSFKESVNLNRSALSERETKETSIHVSLKFDGSITNDNNDNVIIDTGIQTMNDFYKTLANEAIMSLVVKCKGDLWVDDHHTSEDVSIAIGKVINQALGTKAGLNRMWCSTATVGDSTIEVVMDLSNRPCLTHNLSLSYSNDDDDEYIGDLSIEMFDHVLESLVMNSHMTVHIVEHSRGRSKMDMVMATATAFGRALRFCAAVDPRRAGKTASSKGTLSA